MTPATLCRSPIQAGTPTTQSRNQRLDLDIRPLRLSVWWRSRRRRIHRILALRYGAPCLNIEETNPAGDSLSMTANLNADQHDDLVEMVHPGPARI